MTEHDETPKTERFTLHGGDVLEKLRKLIHEGNVRRITVRDRDGNVIFHAPLTIGVVGAALIPLWAAIGAVVALATDCSIDVERANSNHDGHTADLPATISIGKKK